MEVDVKTLELDKVCRVCLSVKKDMRPLYGEMVAEMLMDFARIQVRDGVPGPHSRLFFAPLFF